MFYFFTPFLSFMSWAQKLIQEHRNITPLVSKILTLLNLFCQIVHFYNDKKNVNKWKTYNENFTPCYKIMGLLQQIIKIIYWGLNFNCCFPKIALYLHPLVSVVVYSGSDNVWEVRSWLANHYTSRFFCKNRSRLYLDIVYRYLKRSNVYFIGSQNVLLLVSILVDCLTYVREFTGSNSD